MKSLFVVVLFLVLESNEGKPSYKHVDKTLDENAVGRDVADATVAKIHEYLNVRTDYSLLRRIALVESDDGLDITVTKRNRIGGIWQITPDIHSNLLLYKDDTSGREIPTLIKEIEDAFNIRCFLCTDNFSVTLKSGLAAFLFIQISFIDSNVPGSLIDQANWWANHYHYRASPSKFNQTVSEFESNRQRCRNDANMDIWFLVEGSEVISSEEFQIALNFTQSVGKKIYGQNPSNVRLGFSVYSDNHVFYHMFKQNPSYFSQAVDAAKPTLGKTTTGSALSEVLDQGFQDRDIVNDTIRVLMIATAGNSTDNITEHAILVHSAGIIVYAIGIGNNVEEDDLNILSSQPAEKYSYHLSSYQQLSSALSTQIYKDICETPVQLKVDTEIDLKLEPGEISYFTINLTTEKDLRFNFSTKHNSSNTVYISARISQPNSAFHDISHVLTQGWSQLYVRSTDILLKHPDLARELDDDPNTVDNIPIYISISVLLGSSLEAILVIAERDPGEEEEAKTYAIVLVATSIPIAFAFGSLATVSVAGGGVVVFKRSLRLRNLLEKSKVPEDPKEIEKLIQSLYATTKKARQPSATLACMEQLDELLLCAEEYEIPVSRLKDSYNALRNLKKTIDILRFDMNATTEKAKEPRPNWVVYRNLDHQIQFAEVLDLPKRELREPRRLQEKLKQEFDVILEELQEAIAEAKESSASFPELEKLQSKLASGRNIDLPPDKLREALDAVRDLEKRIGLFYVSEALRLATDNARSQTATVVDMKELQKQVEVAVKAKLPTEQVKESYKVYEHLRKRRDEVGEGRKKLKEALDSEDLENISAAFAPIKSRKEYFLGWDPSDKKFPEMFQKALAFEKQLQEIQEARAAFERKSNLLRERLLQAINDGVDKYEIRKAADEFEEVVGDAASDSDKQLITKAREMFFNITKEALLKALNDGIQSRDLGLLKSAFDLVEDAIPNDITQVQFDNDEELKRTLDKAKKLYADIPILEALRKAVENGKSPTAAVVDMKVLQKQIETALKENIDKDELKESYAVYDHLTRRRDEVNKAKNNLKEALSGGDLKQISAAFSPIKPRQDYFVGWDPDDKEFPGLIEKALAAEMNLGEINQLRERLQQALENDVGKYELRKAADEFEKAVADAASDSDKQLIIKAREKFYNITKEALLKAMNDGIQSRDLTKLKSAFNLVQEALKKDITQVQFDNDKDLKSTFDKAKKVAEEIPILEALKNAAEKGKLKTATVLDMTELQKHIEIAEKAKIEKDRMKESYAVNTTLTKRRDEVSAAKKKLKEALSSGDLVNIATAFAPVKQRKDYFVGWDPNDKEFQEMFEKALAAGKQLQEIEDAKAAHERKVNFLRERLQQALDNTVDKYELREAADEFEKTIGDAASDSDKQLIVKAREKFFNITAEALLKALNDGIQSRDLTKLKSAFNLVQEALKKDITQAQFDNDKDLKSTFDKAKKVAEEIPILEALKKSEEKGKLKTATVLDMKELKKHIEIAEKAKIEKDRMKEGYAVNTTLTKRRDEVAEAKKCLKEALSGGDLVKISTAFAPVKQRKDYFVGWDPNDKEFQEMFEKALAAEKQLQEIEDAKASHERKVNLLRERLQQALDNTVDKYKLREAADEFEKTIGDAASDSDKQLITKAREKFFNITKEALLKALNDGIQSRDLTKLKSAFNLVQEALKKDITQAQFDNDKDLKSTFDKAKKVAEDIPILEALKKATEKGKLPIATVLDMTELKKHIDIAEKAKIEKDRLKEGYAVYDALTKRGEEVSETKKKLKEALSGGDLGKIYAAFSPIKPRKDYFVGWDPSDKEFPELIEKALAAEKKLQGINGLREILQQAINNTVDKYELRKAADEFEKAVADAASDSDKQLIVKAREKFLNITKETLLKSLNDGIQSRDLTKLKSAFNLVQEALKKDITQAQFDNDKNLKSTFDKAKKVTEEIPILEALKKATEKGKLSTATVVDMTELKKHIDIAEKAKIEKDRMKEAYLIYDTLTERQDEVAESKKKLKEELSGGDLKKIAAAFSPIKIRKDYFVGWDPSDKEFPVLIEKALAAQKKLQEINLLREKLQQALNDHVDKYELRKAADQFEKAVGGSAADSDKQLITKAREKFFNITKEALLKALNDGIQSRDLTKLKSAFDLVQDALKKDISQAQFDNDNDLKTTFEKAKKLYAEIQEKHRLLRKNLTDATEVVTLRDAIKAFEEEFAQNMAPENQTMLRDAKRRLIDLIRQQLLGLLKPAISKGKPPELQAALNAVDDAMNQELTQDDVDEDHELRTSIEQARVLLGEMSELDRMREAVMNLKQTTISEIRSYSQPPEQIRRVMEAVYLLLGHKQEKLKEWTAIQALVGKMGKESLKRRIQERKPEQITPDAVEKARAKLDKLKMAEIEEISKASALFFAWSKCIMSEVRDLQAGRS